MRVRSIRLLPRVTSVTRSPSLKASTERPKSRAVSPTSASRKRSGISRTSGAPSSKPGLGRIRVRPFPFPRGISRPRMGTASRARARRSSKFGPVISSSTISEPPNPRPNRDRCRAKPNVPGSANTARAMIGSSSFARVGSVAVAPIKVEVERATNQNLSMRTSPLSHGSILSGNHPAPWVEMREYQEAHSFGISSGSAQ